MIPLKQRKAVEKGLAFLEEKYPDCVERFDLETLDMSDRRNCALAQASGLAYGRAADENNLSEQDQTKYGFHSDATTWTGKHKQYSRLTAAYKELILARRAA